MRSENRKSDNSAGIRMPLLSSENVHIAITNSISLTNVFPSDPYLL